MDFIIENEAIIACFTITFIAKLKSTHLNILVASNSLSPGWILHRLIDWILIWAIYFNQSKVQLLFLCYQIWLVYRLSFQSLLILSILLIFVSWLINIGLTNMLANLEIILICYILAPLNQITYILSLKIEFCNATWTCESTYCLILLTLCFG